MSKDRSIGAGTTYGYEDLRKRLASNETLVAKWLHTVEQTHAEQVILGEGDFRRIILRTLSGDYRQLWFFARK